MVFDQNDSAHDRSDIPGFRVSTNVEGFRHMSAPDGVHPNESEARTLHVQRRCVLRLFKLDSFL